MATLGTASSSVFIQVRRTWTIDIIDGPEFRDRGGNGKPVTRRVIKAGVIATWRPRQQEWYMAVNLTECSVTAAGRLGESVRTLPRDHELYGPLADEITERYRPRTTITVLEDGKVVESASVSDEVRR